MNLAKGAKRSSGRGRTLPPPPICNFATTLTTDLMAEGRPAGRSEGGRGRGAPLKGEFRELRRGLFAQAGAIYLATGVRGGEGERDSVRQRDKLLLYIRFEHSALIVDC